MHALAVIVTTNTRVEGWRVAVDILAALFVAFGIAAGFTYGNSLVFTSFFCTLFVSFILWGLVSISALDDNPPASQKTRLRPLGAVIVLLIPAFLFALSTCIFKGGDIPMDSGKVWVVDGESSGTNDYVIGIPFYSDITGLSLNQSQSHRLIAKTTDGVTIKATTWTELRLRTAYGDLNYHVRLVAQGFTDETLRANVKKLLEGRFEEAVAKRKLAEIETSRLQLEYDTGDWLGWKFKKIGLEWSGSLQISGIHVSFAEQ